MALMGKALTAAGFGHAVGACDRAVTLAGSAHAPAACGAALLARDCPPQQFSPPAPGEGTSRATTLEQAVQWLVERLCTAGVSDGDTTGAQFAPWVALICAEARAAQGPRPVPRLQRDVGLEPPTPTAHSGVLPTPYLTPDSSPAPLRTVHRPDPGRRADRLRAERSASGDESAGVSAGGPGVWSESAVANGCEPEGIPASDDSAASNGSDDPYAAVIAAAVQQTQAAVQHARSVLPTIAGPAATSQPSACREQQGPQQVPRQVPQPLREEEEEIPAPAEQQGQLDSRPPPRLPDQADIAETPSSVKDDNGAQIEPAPTAPASSADAHLAQPDPSDAAGIAEAPFVPAATVSEGTAPVSSTCVPAVSQVRLAAISRVPAEAASVLRRVFTTWSVAGSATPSRVAAGDHPDEWLWGAGSLRCIGEGGQVRALG